MRTPDLARLERFYAVLWAAGRARATQARGSVWLDAGGAVLMVEHARRSSRRIAGGHEGARRVRRRRASSDVAREGSRVEAETQHTLYFRDPDGRRVALSDYLYFA